jgi:O-antigen/teichoic acid export membrane protein
MSTPGDALPLEPSAAPVETAPIPDALVGETAALVDAALFAEEPSSEDRGSFEAATQRVAWNSLIQSVGRLFGYASAVVVLSLTARMLSQGAYGDYTIAFVYVSFVVTFADAGIATIGVREAAKAPERLEEILGAATTLKVLTGLLMYGLAAVIVTFLPYAGEVKIAVYVLCVSLFFTSIGTGFDVAYQSRLRMLAPTLADLGLRAVLFAGTVAVFAYQVTHPVGDQTLFYLVVVIAAVGNLASFLIRWGGVGRVARLRPRLDRRYWGYLLRMAAPMGLALALGQVHYKADTIVLSLLRGSDDVAIYGLAYKVIDFLLMFFGVFAGMVYPVLSRYSNVWDDRFARARTRVLNLCVSLALPAAVGTVLLAPGILQLLGGGKYPQSVLVLQLLAISAVFSFVNMIYNYFIIIQNRQTSLIWVACVNIAANIALNLYAVPRYSYIGSAVATNITECLGMLLSIVVATRVYRSAPMVSLLARSLAACGVMALGVWALQQMGLSQTHIVPTFALAGAGAALYGGVLFALGGVDPAITAQFTSRLPVPLGRLVARPAAKRLDTDHKEH